MRVLKITLLLGYTETLVIKLKTQRTSQWGCIYNCFRVAFLAFSLNRPTLVIDMF